MSSIQEYHIRDLSTRNVVLFPTRAQVIRDVKDVYLRPGQNQIVIDGLSPTVDEHSIKVEGTGAAIVTEVTVDLLPNRDDYHDIYPSEDGTSSDTCSDSDESESDDEPVKAIDTEIEKLQQLLTDKTEVINSCVSRLRFIDSYGHGLSSDRPEADKLNDIIAAYQVERQHIYEDHRAATAACQELQKQIEHQTREQGRRYRAQRNARKPDMKAKSTARKAVLRKKRDMAREKARLRDERNAFWPKKVYKITITLEATGYTPAASRRGSIDSETTINPTLPTVNEPPKESFDMGRLNLSLAYMIYGASWSPRYDLSLNTVNNGGQLDYNAELRNTTSESWRDVKITLSTSQAAFSGLSDTIPTLEPWHVRLMKAYGVQGRTSQQALLSDAELRAKQQEWSKNTGEHGQKPRHELFGRSNIDTAVFKPMPKVVRAHNAPTTNFKGLPHDSRFSSLPPPPPSGPSYSSNVQQNQENSAFGGLSMGANANTGLFGASQQSSRGAGLFGSANNQQPQSSSLFGSSAAPQRPGGGGPFVQASLQVPQIYQAQQMQQVQRSAHEGHQESRDFDDKAAPPEDSLEEDGLSDPILSFEEGAWEETGMTTTYDIPGLKTLSPSHSATKQRIARVDFKNVLFSYLIIGKLRQVAFLKAKLRNTSKVLLLKGPLGITLDGSFLGRTTFPRCSAGETLSLPLGIDPSILVSYSKPTVRRSQSGIFSKEDSNIFTRTCTIRNTKPNKTAEITVLDQIPISEDEKLKIQILEPRGLENEGQSVKVGSGVETENGNWGSAQAELKKGGELSWWVKLNGNKSVKLTLQYGATCPGNETMVGI